MLDVINLIFTVYSAMIVVRLLASWIPQVQHSVVFPFVYQWTEPYLALFRSIIPPLGMMDFSPTVAFLALSILRYFLLSLLSP